MTQIQIPYQNLQPETLTALIEAFVTRDGTDYGEAEIPLEKKIEQIKKLLKRGEAVIIQDEDSAETNIVPKEVLKKLKAQKPKSEEVFDD